jgi:hemerythrin
MSSASNSLESGIRWTKAFSVNVELLDEQHRNLFSKVAQLSQALSQGNGGSVVESVLTDFLQYAQQHFSDEEALMAQHEFPSLPSHRAEHDNFRKQIGGFLEDHKQGKVGVPAQLLLFMQRWLKQHVMHTDKQYSAFLNARGVQ